MNFLYNMCNHNELGQRSLEDVIGIVSHQLRALGHTAVWETSNQRLLTRDTGLNIMVEGFTESTIAMMEEWHMAGARFLILATEEPSPYGFNQGSDPEGLLKLIAEAKAKGEKFTQIKIDYEKALDKEMVLRQRNFPRAAKLSEGILCLVPGKHVTEWYGQWAPTAYVELGYAPTLMRTDEDIEPDYDFSFYGSLTERRMRILRRLARRSGKEKAVRLEGRFSTQAERDRDMRHGKVMLQIRKFEKMGLVSSSRCCTALFLGRPVIAEPHMLSKPWDEIVHFSKSSAAFYNDAIVASATFREIHAKQLQAFKALLTPEFCVGRPMEEIGIWDRFADIRYVPSILNKQAHEDLEKQKKQPAILMPKKAPAIRRDWSSGFGALPTALPTLRTPLLARR